MQDLEYGKVEVGADTEIVPTPLLQTYEGIKHGVKVVLQTSSGII